MLSHQQLTSSRSEDAKRIAAIAAIVIVAGSVAAFVALPSILLIGWLGLR
ncbi:hypothetical protein [Glycomyces terrestris]|nr:hypothetical protein [Glycomyces terrestris]